MTDAFVTLEQLLTDPEPLDIATGKRIKQKGKEVDAVLRVYLRRPNDVEREMCLAVANNARKHLRELLNDTESEEHRLLLLTQLDEANPDLLRQLWISGRMIERLAEMQFESLEEREYVPEPEGDIITAKETDDYLTSINAAEADRQKQLMAALESEQKRLTEEANAIPDEELLQVAIPRHIETLVTREWNDVYTANLIARCTFYDKDYEKPFKTVAQVVKLREQFPTIYRQLADSHSGLLLHPEPGLGFSDGQQDS